MDSRFSLPLLVSTLALLFSLPTAAQTFDISSSAGTRFVVAFPDTSANKFDPRHPNDRYFNRLSLLIFSGADGSVSIRGPRVSKRDTLRAGEFTVVTLTADDGRLDSMLTRICCAPTRQGVFVVDATTPVIIYQHMLTRHGAEAWTPLPVDAWGTDYFVEAMPGEVGIDVSPGGEFDYMTVKRPFPAEFTVVAAHDNTRVTIVPNGRIVGCDRFNVTLAAGEAYQIRSWVDTTTGAVQPDIAGTHVSADKPIAVISGNTRALIDAQDTALTQNSLRNMMMEWVPPRHLAGTEFVYMPTDDSRKPSGSPSESPDGKRQKEHVRLYGVSPNGTGARYVERGEDRTINGVIAEGGFADIGKLPSVPRVYRTDRPAQAAMHSASVLKYAGIAAQWGGIFGTAWDSWGSYSVEMTPRERWVASAPVMPVLYPSGTEHFLHVVTDSVHRGDVLFENGEPFDFNRGAIPGTDLVWGSLKLVSQSGHFLQGRNGARFSGFLYGTYVDGGHEEFRPGGVRPPDDPPGDVPAGVAFHPADYAEYLGISYGYALAARHDLEILLSEPYGMLDFGTVATGSHERTVSFTNTTPREIVVTGVRLARGTADIRIANAPSLPIALASGRALVITVAADVRGAHRQDDPTLLNSLSSEQRDTLIVTTRRDSTCLSISVNGISSVQADPSDGSVAFNDILHHSDGTLDVGFTVPGACGATIELVGLDGGRVAAAEVAPWRSVGSFSFDARALPTGMYLCRLTACGRRVVRPVVIVR